MKRGGRGIGSEEKSGCTWKRIWMGRGGREEQGGAGRSREEQGGAGRSREEQGGDDGQGAGPGGLRLRGSL